MTTLDMKVADNQMREVSSLRTNCSMFRLKIKRSLLLATTYSDDATHLEQVQSNRSFTDDYLLVKR